LIASCALVPGPAAAINWAGHDAWFHDTAPFQHFIEGVPPPLTRPLPSCEELRKRRKTNIYEQLPLPGQNCKET
jgi:hypothetical protein